MGRETTGHSATARPRSWKRFFRFRLRSFFILLTLIIVAGGSWLAWWRTPIKVDRKVTQSGWDHAADVLREAQRRDDQAVLDAMRNRDSAAANPFGGADPFGGAADPFGGAVRVGKGKIYRETFQLVRDLRGNRLKQGPLVVWDLLGHKLREEHWRDDKLHGRWTDRDPWGRKLAEGEYRDGRKHGRWRTYPDGSLEREEEYRNDQRMKQTHFWDNGQRRRSFSFRNGKPHGTAVAWYRNGQKALEVAFADGKRQGLVHGWFPDGSDRLQGEFADDRQVRRWVWWQEDGSVWRETVFVGGRQVENTGAPRLIVVPREEARKGSAAQKIAEQLKEEGSTLEPPIPFEDLCGYYRDVYGINILIDERAWQKAGIDPTRPLPGEPLDITGLLSFESTMRMLVDPLGLAMTYRYESLVFTSLEDAQDWQDRTGVTQILENPQSNLARVFREDTRLEFIDTPLKYVFGFLQDVHTISIRFDESAFADDEPLENYAELPVTSNLKGISLAFALQCVFDGLGLTCVDEDGTLLVRPRDPGAPVPVRSGQLHIWPKRKLGGKPRP